MSMKNKFPCALIFASVAATAFAAPLEFDFKDPKGVNNVIFKTDAPLESINGTATGISGKVTFDPDNPGAFMPVERAHVGAPRRVRQDRPFYAHRLAVAVLDERR